MDNQKAKKFGFFILIGLALFFLILLIYFIWHRYTYAVTDAVFVQADQLVYLSFPKVSGKLVRLYKKEGEPVKKGDLVAELEDLDYSFKVQQLEENLKNLEAQQASLREQIERAEREINLKVEQLLKEKERLKEEEKTRFYLKKAFQSKLEQISKDRKRYEFLYKEGLVSARDLEQLETSEKEITNQIEAINSQLKAIQHQQEVLEKNIALVLNEKKTIASQKYQLKSLIFQREALFNQKKEAQLYYHYTKLYSPIDGIIAKRFHAEGDVLAPGEPVYSIVDPESFYILVLLEETKLKGVKEGSPVRIKIDAYPGEKYEGVVEKILPASAATFALVPRDISAGEFTKLAQRIYIKIKITKGNKNLLRVGLGGEVEIKKVRD
ncbi:MAG: HlyD family secretion protein [Thermodesulfobacteriaceae bacterium]|nr:HlyD family secretion protein [Thermodesulfobacteriaceae bacterium]MCX8040961.1 HlyD family secretion protein [Thermodesulfobacteriaceae bacterium]MDW8135683.1 HlyD family secretion protein [Thermodesulfobacterium sp.]